MWGCLEGRVFSISQNDTDEAPTLQKVCRILRDPGTLDRGKAVLYRNKKLGAGVRIEAWYITHSWFQVFTPNLPEGPHDYFWKLEIDHPELAGVGDYGGVEFADDELVRVLRELKRCRRG